MTVSRFQGPRDTVAATISEADVDVSATDPDGPPPPPFVRERAARRRRTLLLSVTGAAVALVVIGVSVAVAWPTLTGDEDPDVAAGDEEPADPDDGDPPGDDAVPEDAPDEDAPDEDAPDQDTPPGEQPDGETEDGTGEKAPPRPDIDLELDEHGRPDRDVSDAEPHLLPPDPDDVPQDQRPILDLLLDIDASERSMLGFQLDVEAAFGRGRDPNEPDALDDEIRLAAARALEELGLLRERMQASQDQPWAEEVRDSYVTHLDSWVRYLEDIFEDPQILLGDTSRYTLDINRTGAAFSRAVDAPTGAEVDDELVGFAEDIVERGFPPPEDSQV